MKITVLGAGSWGTALAELLSQQRNEVVIWAKEPEIVDSINKEHYNPIYLSQQQLSPTLRAQHSLHDAVNGAQMIVLAIPSGFLREVIMEARNSLLQVEVIVNAAKGLDHKTGMRLSELILSELGISEGSNADKIAVLSGPNLADEVAVKKIGASVAACPDESIGEYLQQVFSRPYFRVYRHTDRAGVELGGTLKNIFAIGAGIVDGLGLGDNAKAAYLTRSLHEMVRLGTALGGRQRTFYGLSGLGDLMATASSPLSRNHRLGQALARGESTEQFTSKTRMIVEGIQTARIANEWGKKLTIPLPITEEICRVLFAGLSPSEAANNLMTRTLKDEET